MHTKHIEILAPAGSFDSLHAAINAGADAIYFGVEDMNMRATAAANFKLEDLDEIAEICHKNNIKSYITLNTLLYDNEIERMHQIIDKVKASKIDAIIAADMSTIMYARSINVEVHISTQLSISNIDAVRFYSQFADRVVLARELRLDQVKEICQKIKELNITGPKGKLVEVEVFAHGAICVAVSGRCAMSLYCYNTSANRGKCTQICRRRYKVTDLDTGKELKVDNNYIMSASDLCTIGMLDKLVDSGICVLKFEGRGRAPEYVDTVIRTYKEALNAIEAREYTEDKIKSWNEDLGTVFNRGLSQGFYMGRKLDEWAGVHGSKATMEKTKIGVVEKYYPKIRVAQVKILAKDSVELNEEFLIVGEATGVVKGKLEQIWVNDQSVKKLVQGDIVTFEVESPVREKDTFYVWRKRTQLQSSD